MIKTITKIGSSYGVVFGKALNAGEVNTLVERTVKDYRKTLRKLA